MLDGVHDPNAFHVREDVDGLLALIAPSLIAQALDYPTSVCKPVAADGFRVYPPAERYSLFVEAHGMTGCASSKAHLLTVSAVRPLH